MNILILGGTGAMGNHLIKQLGGGKNHLTVTSRRAVDNSEYVTYIKGNAKSHEFLFPILDSQNWDAIVDFMCYSTSEFEHLYEKFLSSTRQYVYLSSSRVYADNQDYIVETSSRLLDVGKDEDYISTDEYALAKARQEDILRNSAKTNWTIIRPYVTFSTYRLQLSCEEKESWLYRALHGRSIVISKDLLDKVTSFTYGNDVAAGIAGIIGQESAFGEAFHITTNETTWNDILQIYLDGIEKTTGKRPTLYLTDSYKPFYGGNIEQVRYDRLYNRKFDNSKISHYVDISKFHPLREALLSCISDFVNSPQWLEINWGQEARKDRLTGEFISWDEFAHKLTLKTKIRYLLIRFGLRT